MTTYFRTMKKSECVTTRTPGCLKVNPLPAILLGTTLALFTSLPIRPPVEKYIGRKYLWSFRTPKGKKRKVKQESDWKKYYGSCPELKEDVNLFGKDKFSREILSLHDTKGQTNFEETRQLFLNEVLSQRLTDETPLYYNSNILGRYYRKDYYNK